MRTALKRVEVYFAVHEWALAESVILYVLDRGVKEAKRLVIKAGALQSIDRDIFLFAVQELSKEYGIRVDEVELVIEDPVLKCNVCGYTWSVDLASLDEHVREAIHFLPEAVYAYLKCPNCSSVDFEIVRGRGLSEVLVEGRG